MGTEDFKRGVASVLLAFALVFSMILVTPLASPGDLIYDPGGENIEVESGDNFIIRHVLEWDEPEDGAYSVTMAWDCYDNEPSENFTFLGAEAYFDLDSDNLPDPELDPILAIVILGSVPSPDYPGSTRHTLKVECPAGNKDPRNGQFNVDITLGAYGAGGVPHIPGDHVIPFQFGGIIIVEKYPESWNRDPITIRVGGRGVRVSISPSENSAPPGENVTFTVTVINVGNATDNYDLTVSDNAVPSWAPSLSDNLLVNIRLSENKTATLTVKIPENALPGEEDEITITATSKTDPTVSDNATCIATAAAVMGVEVSISPPENSGDPGETITFTVTVKNTRSVEDNYELETSDNADPSWELIVYPTLLTIPPNSENSATLIVIIFDFASPGEEDEITVTATSKTDPTVSDNATCIARAVFVRGVEVSISPPENSGTPGEDVSFTVTIINTGDVADSYTLKASDNADPSWAPTVSPTFLGILVGDNRTATVSVIVPEGTASGMEDNITVTATSNSDNMVSDNATCIATAAAVMGVEVSISPHENSWIPGENVSFTVAIINTGNVTDNYALTVSDNAVPSWAPSLSDNLLVNIRLSENKTATLTVKIPENALPGEEDNITITATSTENAEISGTASCIASAVVGGVEVSISPIENSAPPGENVTFTVTVTNTGEAEDNYDLIISDDAGWGATLAQNLLTIPFGENRTTTVSVTVPSDANVDESTQITVTATSQMYPVEVTGSASCMMRVFIVRGVDVNLSPGSKSGAPEETLTFTVTVTNTGEAEDNYDLIISDDAGWGATLAQNLLTIPFGGNRTTTVSVTVPSDAIGNESTEITVTATSVENENASESATCIATAAAVMGVEVSISPENQSDVPGKTLTFEVTVKNTGNVEDNYSLAASDNADWSPTPSVSPTSLSVPAGEIRMATLTVIIPDEAPSGEEDEITVTATSTENAEKSGNASCIASAVIGRGVEVSIPSLENSGAPGEIVSFTVTIINKGNVDDSYTLEASDNADPSWAPTVSPTFLGILVGDNGTATVSVIIPEGTAPGIEGEITVTATSNTDNTVSDNATCIATAVTMRRVEVSISPPENSGAPGETLTYEVTVKNTGNVSDNYDLTADDDTTWSLTLPETLTDVVPGESRTVNLGVGIPDDAENSTRDNVTVTVTSRENTNIKDSASCTAHAVVAPQPPPPEYGVQVLISPSSDSGLPGETLTFTVTVKNTGNVDDNYNLTVSDDADWVATLDKNLLTIPAGGNRTTKLRVTIPDEASSGEEDEITVTATSVENENVSDSATPKAIVAGAPEEPGVELPIPLAISVFLIGAAILVPAYLLRRRPKKARGSVLRDVGFGFRERPKKAARRRVLRDVSSGFR